MVMFRDFAQRKARKWSIVGWVKNEPDGSVSLLAQGERALLENYATLLQKGPVLARVDTVDCTWSKPTETFDDFRILY
jgi:acylphosphatase